MANLRITAAGRNAMLDALIAALGSAGTIKIYTGTQPATPETALTGQTLLGTLTLGSPAAPGASGGVSTLNAITEDAAADNAGTATWARCATSGGTAIFDCDVGTAAATINLNSVTIAAGGPIRITSGSLTIPVG